MKEQLLESLFKTITKLRQLEMKLLSDGQILRAEEVRTANRTLSVQRDRLITLQLREASEKLETARAQLSEVSEELEGYLTLRETADSRLDIALSTIPFVLELLESISV